jgi:hypothetical protein
MKVGVGKGTQIVIAAKEIRGVNIVKRACHRHWCCHLISSGHVHKLARLPFAYSGSSDLTAFRVAGANNGYNNNQKKKQNPFMSFSNSVDKAMHS